MTATRLRSEIWLEVAGNATLNPVSVVTRATLGEMFAKTQSQELIRTLMEEVPSLRALYALAKLAESVALKPVD